MKIHPNRIPKPTSTFFTAHARSTSRTSHSPSWTTHSTTNNPRNTLNLNINPSKLTQALCCKRNSNPSIIRNISSQVKWLNRK